MDKDIVKEVLGKKQIKDYTYVILFFLISSFFALAVIRPVLSVAFGLQREAKDLEQLNEVFDRNITTVVQIQSALQEIRPDRHVIEDALPTKPRLYGLMSDIRSAEATAGVQIMSLAVDTVNIKEEKTPQGKLKTVQLSLVMRGDFPQVVQFLAALIDQRRLKSIGSLEMNREGVFGSSGTIRLIVELQGYYL